MLSVFNIDYLNVTFTPDRKGLNISREKHRFVEDNR